TRDLEPPAIDEGFEDIVEVPFVREHRHGGRPGLFVPLKALNELPQLLDAGPKDAPCLVFGWKPDGGESSLMAATGRTIETAVCPHPAGPPIC
ncbi:hypothetical protein NP569_24660, partial [Vibrio parahaemolyticus]|nr:hypothetical protein [Vibrio parahaemolyticus]